MFRSKPVRPGDPVRSDRWNEHEAELERLGRVRTGPGVAARSGPGGLSLALDLPELIWVKVTGQAGADAGYPYAQEYHLPPLEVTARGSGYTTATATLSGGGGGTGATVALTVNPDDGGIDLATLTAAGTNYTSPPTVTVAGDGTGAAVAFNAPWEDSAVAGDGLSDAVYDAGGSRTIPAGPAVYPAIRSPTSGKLVFFGRSGDTWAWLAPGQTVGAATGTGLGTGTVTLADQASGVLTPRTGAGSTVTVYNAGGALSGGTAGYAIKLGVMADGSYSVDVAPCAAGA